MRRNIKLVISYDGTDFCGWQVQNNQRTVQGDIEAALKKIHGTAIRLTGSGRTDSGVHANGQTANFYTENVNIPAEKFQLALNSLLPQDVRILHSCETNEGFHSRYDAKIRVYRYYIQPGGISEPRYSRYCWRIREFPDMARLNRIVAPLVGVHDFTAFTTAGDLSESRVREIYSASFEVEGRFLVFKIAGNAFLWKMIRSITGTALQLEAAGGNSVEMADIINSKDRERAGATAPAKGLFLDRVLYDERTVI